MLTRTVLPGLCRFRIRSNIIVNRLTTIPCGRLKLSIVKALVTRCRGDSRSLRLEARRWLSCMNRLRCLPICISLLYSVVSIECTVLWLGLVRCVCLLLSTVSLGSVLLSLQ